MLAVLLASLLVLVVVLYEVRWQRVRRLHRDLREAVSAQRDLLLSRDRLAQSLGIAETMDLLRSQAEERVRALERSASQMEQIEITFRNMMEGVLVVDRSNRILLSNRSADRLFLRGQPLTGRRIERFLHHPDFLGFLADIRRGHGVERRSFEVDLADRAEVWLEISGAPLGPATAEAPREWTLLLLHDITRLKRLEAIRREFVANVSHELRTPVTVIQGFAETLHEDGEHLRPEQRQAFAEKVHRNAQRLHSLVEDLLSLSRLENEEGGLVRERRCLQEEIRHFAEVEPGGGREGRAPLRLALPTEPLHAEIDPVLFQQVLTNLVENAQQHAESHTFVEIALAASDHGERVILSVSDDGRGIPERARERIFQRFYRLDRGRSRATGGTGLGLSIVRHAMLAHGGTVEVQARAPRGTIFRCLFPAAPAAALPAA